MLLRTSILAAFVALSTFACAAEPSDEAGAAESDINLRAPEAKESRDSVIIVHLATYETFFSSPDSFDGQGTFGINATNKRSVFTSDRESYTVDASIFPLASARPDNFATVGIRFGEESPLTPPDVVEARKHTRLWRDASGKSFPLAFDEDAVQIGAPAIPDVPMIDGDFASLTDRLHEAVQLVKDGKHLVVVNSPLCDTTDTSRPAWGPTGNVAGARARRDMVTQLVPQLRTSLSTKKLTFVIVGDEAHTPGGTDAPNVNATVIGPGVQYGSTGRASANGSLPPNTPPVRSFWSYLADVTHAPATFGPNPHGALVRK